MVGLSIIITTTPVLHKQSVDDCDIYESVSSVYAKQINQVTPEKLRKMWRIGLKADHRTLKATTHQCIGNMGILDKRFKTDKAQLWH